MGSAVNAAENIEELNTFESSPEDLQPGTTLLQGQYTILKYLNSGGFAITYLARDSLDRVVVIKECFPSSFCRRSKASVQARSRAHQGEFKSIVKLFVQEARSLAKLSHPNIVGVHQVFEDNSTAYMALDHIKGRDLLDTLEDRENGLRPAGIKNILIQILGAVKYLHGQNILHRDISPDNILLNDALVPVLIDFGAAREKASKVGKVLSAMRVVKDGYSPQEFYIAGSAQSNSSDLYALGATFYHLITGVIPPESQVRLAAIAGQEPDPYRPLASQELGFDQPFLAALDKSMNVMQRDRLRSADEWLAAIKNTNAKAVIAAVKPSPKVGEQPKSPGDAGKPASVAAAAKPAAANMDAAVNNAVPQARVPMYRKRKFFAKLLLANVPAIGFAGYALLFQPAFLMDMFEPSSSVQTPDSGLPADNEPASSVIVPPMTFQLAAPEPLIMPDGDAVAPIVTTSLSFDDTVAAHTPLESQTLLADNTIEMPQLAPFASLVEQDWSVVIPFEAAGRNVAIVTRVLAGAEDWMKPGQIIDTVNGQTVTSMASLERTVRNSVDPEKVTDVPVVFGVRDEVGGAVTEHRAILQFVQKITLEDGTAFLTKFLNGAWKSQVSVVPGHSTGNLEVGDTMSAYLGTKEMISGRTTLGQIIDREFKAGKDRLDFMIDRDGSDLFASIGVSQVGGHKQASNNGLTTGN